MGLIPTMIVPTLVHYELLQNMLNTIDVKVEHLIIIDNGGKLNSIVCSNAEKISIINMPRNLGVATSWNLGIKLTPFSKWWLIASDDIEFLPGRLSKIVESNFTTFIYDKNTPRVFSSFAIHENVVDKIGLFNEYFYPGFGEEIDYLNRISLNNIKIYSHKFFKDVGRGGNTIDLFIMNLHQEKGEKLKEVFREYTNAKNKFPNDWDLEHRRYMESILSRDS